MVVVRLFTAGDGRLYLWRGKDFSFANMQGIEHNYLSICMLATTLIVADN